jgi:hypothetical protein
VNRDDDRGFWTMAIALAIAVVAALHAYSGVIGQGASVTPKAAVPPPASTTAQTASTPTPRTIAGLPSSRIATVYECQQRGERVFSDRRCGSNAQARAIEAPNGMEPPDPSVVELSQSEHDPAPVAVSPATPVARSDGQDIRCRAIEEEKERIDARMREGYRSAEGERLRDRLRTLDADYYDLRCHHFRS